MAELCSELWNELWDDINYEGEVDDNGILWQMTDGKWAPFVCVDGKWEQLVEKVEIYKPERPKEWDQNDQRLKDANAEVARSEAEACVGVPIRSFWHEVQPDGSWIFVPVA